MSRYLLALVAIGLASACATDGGHTASSPAADTLPDGTIHVTYSIPLDAVPRQDGELSEEMRIGQVDGPEPYNFGRIDAVVPHRDGSVYVLDAQVPVIRQYDADGNHVRDVGGVGRGPGEYTTILGMGVTPDGNLAVWDIGNRRISVYAHDGTFLTSHGVDSSLHAPDAFRVDRTGHYYVRIPAPSNVEEMRSYLRISPAGAVTDTFYVPDARSDTPTFVLAAMEGPLEPFTRGVVSAFKPEGYVVEGHNERYALTIVRPDESRVQIEREHTPVPVNRTEREEWRAWAALFERAGSGPYVIPGTKPAFRAVFLDEERRVWVHRYVASEERAPPERPPSDPRPVRRWHEPPTFDVYTSDGVFLGTVVLPHGARVHAARHDEIWITKPGDFDTPSVVKLRWNR